MVHDQLHQTRRSRFHHVRPPRRIVVQGHVQLQRIVFLGYAKEKYLP
jgi:hypothetical protein